MARVQTACLLTMLSVAAAATVTAQELPPDRRLLVWPPQETITPFLLHEDPYLPIPAATPHANPAFLPLLKEALASDENDMKRDAAVSVTSLHAGGFLDCASMADSLTDVLKSPDENRLVLRNVARALVTIDARQSADVLFSTIGRDADLVRIIEPALARWRHAPAQNEWRRRLQQPENEPVFLVQSAIRQLGISGDEQATPLLEAIVLNSPRAIYRAAAAEALGNIRHSGLERLAARLLEDQTAVLGQSSIGRDTLHSLMAARILSGHDSAEARQILLRLAEHSNGGVASIAWQSLLRTSAVELRPLTELGARASDGKVRLLTVQTLLATADHEAVDQLGRLLNDPHPLVRNAARSALLEISEQPQLRDSVFAAGLAALQRSGWQELEQSAVLLGTLDFEPAATRCLELLDHPRPEAAIAAAWALRKMAILDTRPRMLAFCEKIDTRLVSGKPVGQSAPFVVGHLFEAMGQMGFEPAENLMRRYIAKRPPRLLSPMRQSAINALGWLRAGSRDEELSKRFFQRMTDESPFPVYELDAVRYASALAIGRIQAPAFLQKLQQRYSPQSSGPVSYAVGWAIAQYTGQPVAEPVPMSRSLPLLPIRPIDFRLKTDSSPPTAGAAAAP